MLRAIVILALMLCSAPVLADEPKIAITLRDHQFVPAEVPVPAGVKVELVVTNQQTTPAEFESKALHREKVIAPGGTVSIFVGPLSAGRYEFLDDFHPATRGVLAVR